MESSKETIMEYPKIHSLWKSEGSIDSEEKESIITILHERSPTPYPSQLSQI